MNVDTDLIEWIAEQYDPEFIVELLGISSKELDKMTNSRVTDPLLAVQQDIREAV